MQVLEPAVPVAVRAEFTAAGTAVVVSFDSDTDVGLSEGLLSSRYKGGFQPTLEHLVLTRIRLPSPCIPYLSFPCSDVFAFTSAEESACRWAGSRQVVLERSALDVGSALQVRANRLRAKCPTSVHSAVCAAWGRNTAQTLAVAAPPTPVIPSLTLRLTPQLSLSECQPLSLSMGGSSGNGGRDWASVRLSVNGDSTSPRLLYQSAELRNTSATVFPRGQFSLDEYHSFQLEVCSFLGGCATRSVGIFALASEIKPVVAINR